MRATGLYIRSLTTHLPFVLTLCLNRRVYQDPLDIYRINPVYGITLLLSTFVLQNRYFSRYNPKNPEKKLYIREDDILKQVEDVFAGIGIRDPEILKDTLAHLKNTNEAKKAHHIQETAALKKEHTEIESKLDSLVDLRINSELSKEEFQIKKQKLKDRQYEIRELLRTYDEADDKFSDTTATLINLASEALETFKGSEMAQKRKMLNFVFQNLKLKGCKLEYTLRFPFDIFEKTTTRTGWRRERDSNPR